MFLADAVSDHNLLTELTVGQLLGILATVGVIVGIVVKINPIMHRLNELLDDWFGEKPRPGVKGRKGVMERLSDQDAAISRIDPIVNPSAEGNHEEVLRGLADNRHQLRRIERLLVRHIRESKVWVGEVTSKAKESDFDVPPWPNLPEITVEDEGDDPARH